MTVLTGTEDSDALEGGFGEDTIIGLGGDDFLTGGGGDDFVYGGDGDDNVDGGDGNDTLEGGAGNDIFDAGVSGSGSDSISGGDGNDTVFNVGRNGNADAVDLGAGNDTASVHDASAAAVITTGTGSDRIVIENFNEHADNLAVVTDFTAGVGGDVIALEYLLYNGTGWDGSTNPFGSGLLQLVQVGSNTVLRIDAHGDGLVDLVTLQGVTATSITIDNFDPPFPPDGSPLPGEDLIGTEDVDYLYGGQLSDTITGLGGDDLLDGNAGYDTIYGGNGDDDIYGGVGNDTLEGGAGDDELYAGSDNDAVFAGSGNDFIRLSGAIGELDSVDGGDGTDTVQFDGDRADYSAGATGGIGGPTEMYVNYIGSPAGGAGGYATLVNVEFVQFNDQTVSVADLIGVPNSPPVITSNGGGATAAVALAENTGTENGTAVTTVAATDPDAGATRTYTITGGADAALFAIDATTGVLTFRSAPNFEAPGDAGADNVYDLVVQVSDGTLTDAQALAVTVSNANEAPVITSGGGGATAAVALVENTGTENGTAVTTVTATDPDAGATRTFTITGGADAALFAIDATTGVLTFRSAPNFEAPGDTGADNVYDLVVQVSDGTLTDAQALAVTVSNANEAPVITSNGGGATAAVALVENGTAVTTVTASDPDAGATRTYTITGGADAALFAIDATTGVLTFRSAPNFEAPGDTGANNVYDLVVQVSDGSATDAQALAVTVSNANEAPLITSGGGGATAVIAAAENTTAVTTLLATDPDAGAARTFTITGGADAALFAIDATTGVLTFRSAPNFEAPGDTGANNVYDLVVQVSDGSATDAQALAVTVSNANEAPLITSGGGGATAVIAAAENTTAVTTLLATDPDAGAARTFTITGGADAALFAIDATTGVLTFRSAPNFEAPGDTGANNVYDLVVQVSDGTLTDAQALAVTVSNANEAPVITSNGGGATAAVALVENGTAVTTVTATDPDAGATRTFTITGGADAALFAIDATTGVLTFRSAPNFEAPGDTGANNVYDLVVQVSDGTLTDAQALAVTVSNANEAPVITSNGGGATAAVALVENGTAVTTVTATDPDAGATRTFTITGGADAALFAIDATTGVLTFRSAPNFEAPGDTGANNVYDLVVQVSDGTLTDAQALAVTVSNANEAPVITSGGGGATAAVTVAENTGTENGTAVTTVTATDPDAGAARTFTITGGADAALFAIDATTGVLTFRSAPNFEAPGDTGANNVYDLVVQVSDGTLTDAQALAVTVTNSTTGVTISGTSGNDMISPSQTAPGHRFATDENDHISGLDGNDMLDGGGGTDTLIGGAGNDTYATNGGDTITEGSGAGTDTVRSLVTLTLAANLENLTLTGSAAIKGTGNTLANTILGNSGANVLNGGGGSDAFRGGAGNDTYVTDGRDTITERSRAGTDLVQSTVTLKLGSNLENLTLTGLAAINGTGNTLANKIVGNGAANVLNGATGHDSLKGGGGSDTFVFNTALGRSNIDKIKDYHVAADTIRLENAIFTGLANGILTGSAFVSNASGYAADASDRIIYEKDTGALFFDKDGAGGTAKVQFATIGTHLAVTSADFFVF